MTEKFTGLFKSIFRGKSFFMLTLLITAGCAGGVKTETKDAPSAVPNATASYKGCEISLNFEMLPNKMQEANLKYFWRAKDAAAFTGINQAGTLGLDYEYVEFSQAVPQSFDSGWQEKVIDGVSCRLFKGDIEGVIRETLTCMRESKSWEFRFTADDTKENAAEIERIIAGISLK